LSHGLALSRERLVRFLDLVALLLSEAKMLRCRLKALGDRLLQQIHFRPDVAGFLRPTDRHQSTHRHHPTTRNPPSTPQPHHTILTTSPPLRGAHSHQETASPPIKTPPPAMPHDHCLAARHSNRRPSVSRVGLDM